MLEKKIKYVWHMSNHYWEKAMTKYETTSMSFKNVHQRWLDKIQSAARRKFKAHRNNGLN